jgi:hypothetical protein
VDRLLFRVRVAAVASIFGQVSCGTSTPEQLAVSELIDPTPKIFQQEWPEQLERLLAVSPSNEHLH